MDTLGADPLTFNGSKIGGPRGIGVLYVRQGVALIPQVLGGGARKRTKSRHGKPSRHIGFGQSGIFN
ncbi:MAG: aminotransferase class V-fold PLP-dependent enzyme [Candidatus Yanofskybacteria bacterium]|nr:aminotransferase class V-fold PLP-dependent enzyme [Candidatus Yanofskybacteria bacterium]